MTWAVAINKLDADQRDLVDNRVDSKLWIQGFAGTGKSVVLAHKLRKVYDDNPNAICCIITFTHSLREMFNLGLEELGTNLRVTKERNICCAKAGEIDIVTKYEFKANANKGNDAIKYDVLFVDEIQDLCLSDLNVIKNSTSVVSYFLAGDVNQSIFSKDPRDGEVTLNTNEILSTLTPKEFKLTFLYRITPSILKLVKKYIPELENELKGYRTINRDTDVILANANLEKDEVAYVYEQALNYAEDIELTAILLPKHDWIFDFCKYVIEKVGANLTEDVIRMFSVKDYTAINTFFQNNNIKIEYVGNDHGSFRHARDNNKIILMTYHSAKGMDFQNVFIPFLSISRHYRVDLFFPRPLMVAMTRSNYNLTISYSGESMACVESFKEVCLNIPINSNDDELDEPFDLPH